MADKAQKKEVQNAEYIDIQVPLSKAEIKLIVKDNINRMWQDTWGQEEKGRLLYSIQKEMIKVLNGLTFSTSWYDSLGSS